MKLYRSKPVIIQAARYIKGQSVPQGVQWRTETDTETREKTKRPYVLTMHDQVVFLEDGDWVIKEPVPDRYYPCKHTVFEAKYEPVGATAEEFLPTHL